MSRVRDYAAEYRRRQQLARVRGFSSYAQQRRFSPRLRWGRDLGRLPEPARYARSEALYVVAVARDRRLTIEEAARVERVPLPAVRWWARDALAPRRRGRTLPRKGDRMLRLQPIFLDGGDGVEFVPIRGSHAARRAQGIFDVQYRFIAGDVSQAELRTIAGQRVAGRLVESDPHRLTAIGEADGADIDEAYRAVLG
jgi:hypothetical protein